jgi:hypothetical protein
MATNSVRGLQKKMRKHDEGFAGSKNPAGGIVRV